jgi:GTP-binding protein
MSTLRNIEFVTTVADLRTLPPAHGAEVAFAGRSNAGKSSAINALAQRTRMAFVSKTPGRTQHINFFSVGPAQFLVDLPGYGYAAVPAAARAHWHDLVGGYLQTRECLRGVILIMDSRRPMLSKADKLGQQQGAATLRDVNAALARRYAHCTAQLFSSTRKLGLAEAAQIIHRWLSVGRNKKPPVKGE